MSKEAKEGSFIGPLFFCLPTKPFYERYQAVYHRSYEYKHVNLIAVLVFLAVSVVGCVSCAYYAHIFSSDLLKCDKSTSDWESYYRIELHPDIEVKFPYYKLYVIGELFTEALYMPKNFSYSCNESLNGVPILFIPGNAGFHEQGRTLSTILTNMVKDRGFKDKFHFDFFTIDFHEEKLALSGIYLYRAKEYVEHAVKRIAGLYPDGTKEVLLIGHSLGGVIGRSIEDFGKISRVLVSIAAPQRAPFVSTDYLINQFYERELKEPSENRFVYSFAPGPRDFIIPAHLTYLGEGPYIYHAAYEAIANSWLSADHRESMYCNSACIVVARMIFDWVDPKSSRFIESWIEKKEIADFHLKQNPGIKSFRQSQTESFVSDNLWCLRGEQVNSSFTVYSPNSDAIRLFGQAKNGSYSDLTARHFSVLPPYEKQINGRNLVSSHKFLHVTKESIENLGFDKLCFLKDHEKYFGGESVYNSHGVSLKTGYISVSEDTMLYQFDGTDLEASYYLYDITFNSSCDSGSFIFEREEEGRKSFEIQKGVSVITVATWPSYPSTALCRVVKPLHCSISLTFHQSWAGYAHYFRSYVPVLGSLFVTVALLFVEDSLNHAHSQNNLLILSFKTSFVVKLALFATASSLPYFAVFSNTLEKLSGISLPLSSYVSNYPPCLYIPIWCFLVILNAILELLISVTYFIRQMLGFNIPWLLAVTTFCGLLFVIPSAALLILNLVYLSDIFSVLRNQEQKKLTILLKLGLFCTLILSFPSFGFYAILLTHCKHFSCLVFDQSSLRAIAGFGFYLLTLWVRRNPESLKNVESQSWLPSWLFFFLLLFFNFTFLFKLYAISILAGVMFIFLLVSKKTSFAFLKS